MAPTIAEMATITYKGVDVQQVWKALRTIGEAIEAMARVIADNVSTALQGLVRELSAPTAPALRSYPGVDMQFRHRGRR